MSRYGLRKLLFRLKNTIFMRYYAVNGACLSVGLPIGKKLGSNSTLMYRKTLCKVIQQCTEYIFVLIQN